MHPIENKKRIKLNILNRYIPKHRIQYKVWWFVTSQPFEYAIFVLIMINTITLAMKYHNQSPEYSKALDLLNMLFTAVFALEFIFKLAAFRFKVSFIIFHVDLLYYICLFFCTLLGLQLVQV